MFDNFLKIIPLYTLKQVPRHSSNHYHDEKDEVYHQRRETTAEHVYSSLRLADFFLTTEREFADLNRLHVYQLLMYHDDVEIITRDTGISERLKRKGKHERELAALPLLQQQLPQGLDQKLFDLDQEFRAQETPEARFAKAIDKMDSLVHELQYPLDWGLKGFTEKNVRSWFQPAFDHSPTFSRYFEATIEYLRANGYF
ncbi:MAG: HD domain-containing protein [Nanobdellota archaeon]